MLDPEARAAQAPDHDVRAMQKRQAKRVEEERRAKEAQIKRVAKNQAPGVVEEETGCCKAFCKKCCCCCGADNDADHAPPKARVKASSPRLTTGKELTSTDDVQVNPNPLEVTEASGDTTIHIDIKDTV